MSTGSYRRNRMFRIACVGMICVSCGGRVRWDASVSDDAVQEHTAVAGNA